ncbi:30763_t:CDS:2, partial [Racocetra persica]
GIIYHEMKEKQMIKQYLDHLNQESYPTIDYSDPYSIKSAMETWFSGEHWEQVVDNALLSIRYEEQEHYFKNTMFYLRNPRYPDFFYPNHCEFKDSFAAQRNLPENHNDGYSDFLDKYYLDFMKEPLLSETSYKGVRMPIARKESCEVALKSLPSGSNTLNCLEEFKNHMECRLNGIGLK